MHDENKLAEITAKLNELNTARTTDTARLEIKLQEVLSAIQAVQEEIKTLNPDNGNVITFS